MELFLHGTGMYMMMACTLIFSLHIQTVCGGTGDGHTVSMVQDGDLVLDGILHGTLLGIMVDGTLHGMPVIGVDTGEVIGEPDGIITTIILIMDGTVVGIAQDIQTTDRADISRITGVIQLPVQVRRIPDDHNHHLQLLRIELIRQPDVRLLVGW